MVVIRVMEDWQSSSKLTIDVELRSDVTIFIQYVAIYALASSLTNNHNFYYKIDICRVKCHSSVK